MTLISVAQMNSQDDIENNFQVIESLIQQSKAQNASLIVFPENFVCFAAGKQRETTEQFESIQQRLEKLASISNLDCGRYLTMSISSRWIYHSRWSSQDG